MGIFIQKSEDHTSESPSPTNVTQGSKKKSMFYRKKAMSSYQVMKPVELMEDITMFASQFEKLDK